MEIDYNKEDLIEIIHLEDKLKNIKDIDILLENILSCARKIANADAGSIYEYSNKENKLTIRYSQNDTLQKKLAPGEKLPYNFFSLVPTKESISGYSVISKKIINIEDVYNLPEYLDKDQTEKRPYQFSKYSDEKTNYHTKSMLTLPLLTRNGNVLGVLQIINAQDKDGNVVPFSPKAEFYISQFAYRVSSIYENAYLIRQNFDRLIKMAELRDPRETGAHVERVASFAVEIYDRYAINKNIDENDSAKFRDNLRVAARCHDVGKVAIPDDILKKHGILTEEERSIMKGHTCVGAQIFTPIENDLDDMVKDVCLHHHDRWDGGSSGYPGNFDYMDYIPATRMPENKEQSYKENEIPLAARIVSLADVYDALRHKRCYKDEWTEQDTVDEIQSQSGKQFDPDLVEAFMQVRSRLEDINRSI